MQAGWLSRYQRRLICFWRLYGKSHSPHCCQKCKAVRVSISPGTAYVSEQTHSSVSKGLRIIGLRTDQIRKIPTDSDFRINITLLKDAVSEDLAAGKIPFAVIANAGSTNTGSIDPFNEITALCEKHHIWMHVDGAYGASVLASSKYRHRLQGNRTRRQYQLGCA